MMAAIVAKRLVEHLERSGFVITKKSRRARAARRMTRVLFAAT
jgi:hypothetical protein